MPSWWEPTSHRGRQHVNETCGTAAAFARASGSLSRARARPRFGILRRAPPRNYSGALRLRLRPTVEWPPSRCVANLRVHPRPLGPGRVREQPPSGPLIVIGFRAEFLDEVLAGLNSAVVLAERAVGAATIAASRRRSAALTFTTIPLRIPQTRNACKPPGILKGTRSSGRYHCRPGYPAVGESR